VVLTKFTTIPRAAADRPRTRRLKVDFIRSNILKILLLLLILF